MAEKRRLMGAHEIAERLGVRRHRGQEIISRRDFPGPYDTIAAGRIWLARDVEAWIREHRPNLATQP